MNKLWFAVGLLAVVPFYFHQSFITAALAMVGIMVSVAAYIFIMMQYRNERKEERMEILKRLSICIVMIFLTTGIAMASPFMVSDPEPTVIGGIFEIWQGPAGLITVTQITSQATMIAAQATEADGSVRYDMANINKGTYYWYVRYGQSWGTYGDPPTEVPTMTYSPFVDFTFTKKSNAIVGTKAFKIVQ